MEADYKLIDNEERHQYEFHVCLLYTSDAADE